MNLILQKHNHNEDPLLEFRWILEILPVTDIVVIGGKSQDLCNLDKQWILGYVVYDQCVQVLLKHEEIDIHQQDNVIANKALRVQDVCHKEKYQEDVVKIDFVNSTEENGNECHQIKVFNQHK